MSRRCDLIKTYRQFLYRESWLKSHIPLNPFEFLVIQWNLGLETGALWKLTNLEEVRHYCVFFDQLSVRGLVVDPGEGRGWLRLGYDPCWQPFVQITALEPKRGAF